MSVNNKINYMDQSSVLHGLVHNIGAGGVNEAGGIIYGRCNNKRRVQFYRRRSKALGNLR